MSAKLKPQTSKVSPIPKGFTTITPFLMVENADKVLEFIKDGLGGKVTHSMNDKNGKLMHAQIQIGDSMIMLGDSMGKDKSMPSSVYLYVNDVDALFERAIDAGGEEISEVKDQFYGDRSGGVKDPAGNIWWIATHIEDVPDDEMAKRAKEACQ